MIRGRRIRIAIAGLGRWGVNYVTTLAGMSEAEVVALVDPDPQALARASQLVPRAARYDKLAPALSGSADGIVICSPSHTHADLCVAALSAGKRVLVEKPLATDLAGAAAVARTAGALDRLLVGHLTLHHPAVSWLLNTSKSGLLGSLVRVEARRISCGSARSAESALWALGPHDLAVAVRLLGHPAEARSIFLSACGQEARAEWRFGSGAVFQVELSRLGPTSLRTTSVVGTDGRATIDEQTGARTLTRGTTTEVLPPFTGGPLTAQCLHFTRWARGEEPASTGTLDGVLVVAALVAAQRSQERGGVFVPLDICAPPAGLNVPQQPGIELADSMSLGAASPAR